MPSDLTAPAGFERLEKGFFCGKTRGIRLGSGNTFALTIFAFAVGENAGRKTRRSGDGVADAIDFGYVDTD